MSENASRLQAIQQITQRKTIPVEKTDLLGKIWTDDVFNLTRMEWALSKTAFKAIKKTVQTGEPLDAASASGSVSSWQQRGKMLHRPQSHALHNDLAPAQVGGVLRQRPDPAGFGHVSAHLPGLPAVREGGGVDSIPEQRLIRICTYTTWILCTQIGAFVTWLLETELLVLIAQGFRQCDRVIAKIPGLLWRAFIATVELLKMRVSVNIENF